MSNYLRTEKLSLEAQKSAARFTRENVQEGGEQFLREHAAASRAPLVFAHNTPNGLREGFDAESPAAAKFLRSLYYGAHSSSSFKRMVGGVVSLVEVTDEFVQRASQFGYKVSSEDPSRTVLTPKVRRKRKSN